MLRLFPVYAAPFSWPRDAGAEIRNRSELNTDSSLKRCM